MLEASATSASGSTFGYRGNATGSSNFRSTTGTFVGFRRESQNSASRAQTTKGFEAWRRKSVRMPKEGVYLRLDLGVSHSLDLPHAANDLSARMSRKSRDSGDQEFDSFDHVKAIHSDYGLSSISTAAFDEDHIGVASRSSFTSICSEEASEVSREPNRLTHEQHLENLNEFFQGLDTDPTELEDAVDAKRIILLQRRLNAEMTIKDADACLKKSLEELVVWCLNKPNELPFLQDSRSKCDGHPTAGEDLGGFGHQCVELVHENQFYLSAGDAGIGSCSYGWLAVVRGDHLEQLIWPYLRFAICVPRDCPTIAEALTEIPDWCPVTVLLARGKYVEEGLVIKKPVALRGNGKVQLCSNDGPLSVNCEGPGSPQLCNLDIESSIEIVAGAPVLKSCNLSGDSGITVRGSAKPQIEHCSFKAKGSTVLSLRDDAEVKLSDCSFSENVGTCIAARNSATAVVERGNFTQNGAPVIQLRDSTTLRLSDSRLDSNNGCGILVRGDATAHISSSQLSGHKMSAVAFQHQATGSVSKSRLERNDGAVLLINGTAKGIMVEDNDFCNNGRSAPVIEFKASTGAVKAKIVAKREDETNGLTHKLAYISGQSGEEWADLDEGKSMIRNQSGNVDVPYKLKDPIRAGKAHDGEGGQMKGVSLTKGTKRCVIAIKDSAQAA
eukprot:s1248_g3.t1